MKKRKHWTLRGRQAPQRRSTVDWQGRGWYVPTSKRGTRLHYTKVITGPSTGLEAYNTYGRPCYLTRKPRREGGRK